MDTDYSIIQHIKNNQVDKGFNLLVKEYHKKVYWQVRRMVLVHEDADDVTQNIFIKIFNNLSGFREDSKLSSWIYRIAYNESLNFLKKRAKVSEVTTDIYLQKTVGELSDDPYFDASEINMKFQKALASLPQKQQAIFKMRYYDDLSYEEISTILGTTVGGLKANYHHAEKKIEEYLKNIN